MKRFASFLFSFLLLCSMMLPSSAVADDYYYGPEYDQDYESEYWDDYEGEPEYDGFNPEYMTDEGYDYYNALLAAPIGSRVYTGINYICGDNWYKFYEDEYTVYFLYGDYYRTEWLYFGYTNEMIWETGMTTRGSYELLPIDGNSETLLNYLQDDTKWPGLTEAFENAFPLHAVRVIGGPTKEQVEYVARNYSSVSKMLRPYEGTVEGCLGYWLSSGYEKETYRTILIDVYLYNCVLLGNGIEPNTPSNGGAVRPFVAVSKSVREKTPEELEEEAKIAAQDAAMAGSFIQAGDHTLQYGRYMGGDEIYDIYEDGTLVYTSPDFYATGTFFVQAEDDDYTEWDNTMQFVVYFDGEYGGGRDWLDIPEDNVLQNWEGKRYTLVME